MTAHPETAFTQPLVRPSATSTGSPVIQLRGITKTFGPKMAVNNLDLTIPERSVYGFIGPNGAGKTTTIRMIMSIIFPDRGELSVLGRASAVESKDQIGYLPEERGVYRKMKVGAFLNYMARLKGMDAAGLDRKVRDWLERVNLAETYRKKCEELSKGMQQKVQFIAAVIHDPELIILDEPFSGLDPVNRRLLRELIDEQRMKKRTLIFSTHAMFEAEQLCTHLFMIHKGEKKLDDSVDAILRKHDPRAVQVEPLDSASIADRRWDAIPGVSEVRRHDTWLELRLSESAAKETIMPIATTIAPLRRIELARPNLEQIFIHLVGGDAAALAAEREEFEPDSGAHASSMRSSGGDA
jgi:ABC-2 type transport system ATP-binding protein